MMAEEHIELRFSVDSAVRIFHIMESKDCLVSLIQTNLHASTYWYLDYYTKLVIG